MYIKLSVRQFSYFWSNNKERNPRIYYIADDNIYIEINVYYNKIREWFEIYYPGAEMQNAGFTLTKEEMAAILSSIYNELPGNAEPVKNYLN